MLDIQSWLKESTTKLQAHSDSARLDAEILLAFAINQDRTYLYTHPQQRLNEEQLRQARTLLNQRIQGTPIAYITGHQEFWSLPIHVTQDTLIPRPETELLVELALTFLKELSEPTVIDLGTGSGAIALAIAKERPDAKVIAADISPRALTVAQINQQRLQIKNLTLIESDWLSQFDEIRADVIVSNPPYIAINDGRLEDNVKKYEPKGALISDQEGLKDSTVIIQQARQFLKPQGQLAIETGIDSADSLFQLFETHGYEYCQKHHDLQNIARIVSGSHPLRDKF